MSYYLEIDGEQVSQFASSTGYGDFGRWINSLPNEYPELRSFIDDGFSENGAVLLNELKAAIEKSPPDDPNTVDTANGLIEMLDGAEDETTVGVTNGMTADDE